MDVRTCFKCKEDFLCNPQKVPMIKKKPVCRICVEIINEARRDMGLVEIYVDGAYPEGVK